MQFDTELDNNSGLNHAAYSYLRIYFSVDIGIFYSLKHFQMLKVQTNIWEVIRQWELFT